VNDPEYTLAWPDGIGDGLPERLWVRDDLTSVEDYPAGDLAGGLTSLGFITAALGRRAQFWCATALLGLLVGCGFYFMSPPAHQASASVLLTIGPNENITTAESNDLAIAESRAVAGIALRTLGLQESADSFLGSYSATPITERVMTITASAPSSDQAVLRANAVARAFLQFRANEMQTEEKLELASLNQQVNQAQQQLNSINARISRLSARPTTSARRSQLKSLEAQRSHTTYVVYTFEQALLTGQTGLQPATAAAMRGSVLLDAAAPLRYSWLKSLLRDAAIGLVAGLALGIGIVVIQALVSDRLRRREDVARALGAPVRLSVGSVRPNRWLPTLPRQAAARDANVRRIAAHLGRVASGRSQSAAALAVVPVDDLRAPALSLASLALSCAGQGKQVVVADLCSGAPAAQLLGAEGPGVRTVSTHGTSLVVAVPERDGPLPADPLPVGPLPASPLDPGSAQAQRSSFTEAVTVACASADLLLTLVTLDPSLGGEHLATWATDAVAVVTAGRSSWTKVHGVGELVRLSGVRLVSAVLVGADKSDESVGVVRAPEMV
jgi:capsular polysaccharide biosynthesis protein